jgi:hypothetical protein
VAALKRQLHASSDNEVFDYLVTVGTNQRDDLEQLVYSLFGNLADSLAHRFQGLETVSQLHLALTDTYIKYALSALPEVAPATTNLRPGSKSTRTSKNAPSDGALHVRFTSSLTVCLTQWSGEVARDKNSLPLIPCECDIIEMYIAVDASARIGRTWQKPESTSYPGRFICNFQWASRRNSSSMASERPRNSAFRARLY